MGTADISEEEFESRENKRLKLAPKAVDVDVKRVNAIQRAQMAGEEFLFIIVAAILLLMFAIILTWGAIARSADIAIPSIIPLGISGLIILAIMAKRKIQGP